MKTRKVNTSALIFGLLVELTFSIFLGFTGIAMGLARDFQNSTLLPSHLPVQAGK